MSTQSEESYLRTDAVPDNVNITTEHAKHKPPNVSKDTQEEKQKENVSDSNKKKKDYKPKFDGTGIPTKVYGNVINISNGSNIHVGPEFVYNFGMKPGKMKAPKTVQKTKAIEKVLSSTEKVTGDHLNIISTHVGENWKDLGRKLNYSDGQLDQFYINFKSSLLKEVIYQMLLDWTRTNPLVSNIGSLSTALWDCDMKEVVEKLVSP